MHIYVCNIRGCLKDIRPLIEKNILLMGLGPFKVSYLLPHLCSRLHCRTEIAFALNICSCSCSLYWSILVNSLRLLALQGSFLTRGLHGPDFSVRARPGPARSKGKNFGPSRARAEREIEISARVRPGPTNFFYRYRPRQLDFKTSPFSCLHIINVFFCC